MTFYNQTLWSKFLTFSQVSITVSTYFFILLLPLSHWTDSMYLKTCSLHSIFCVFWLVFNSGKDCLDVQSFQLSICNAKVFKVLWMVRQIKESWGLFACLWTYYFTFLLEKPLFQLSGVHTLICRTWPIYMQWIAQFPILTILIETPCIMFFVLLWAKIVFLKMYIAQFCFALIELLNVFQVFKAHLTKNVGLKTYFFNVKIPITSLFINQLQEWD